MNKKEIKLNQEDIKSIDKDYKNNKFFHKGEKVKVVNPDSKYYGLSGNFIKVETTQSINNNYIIEINDYENIELLRKILDKVKGLRSDFKRDFVLVYDNPEDKYNLSKMKLLKFSSPYNTGFISFDGLTDDMNYHQETISAEYNIKDLYLGIKHSFKMQQEWEKQI